MEELDRERAEYEFIHIDELELRPARWYEFSRHYQKLVEAVEQTRRDRRVRYERITGYSEQAEKNFVYRLACVDFPASPWLTLPPEQRTLLIDMPLTWEFRRGEPQGLILGLEPVVGAVPPPYKPLNLPFEQQQKEMTESGQWFSWEADENSPQPVQPHESYGAQYDDWKAFASVTLRGKVDFNELLLGFVAIDLRAHRDDIFGALGCYLIMYHPSGGDNWTRKAGRKSLWDHMRALAALRLRHRYRNFTKAQHRMAALKDGPHAFYYGDRGSWDDACKRAVEYFREIVKPTSEHELPTGADTDWTA